MAIKVLFPKPICSFFFFARAQCGEKQFELTQMCAKSDLRRLTGWHSGRWSRINNTAKETTYLHTEVKTNSASSYLPSTVGRVARYRGKTNSPPPPPASPTKVVLCPGENTAKPGAALFRSRIPAARAPCWRVSRLVCKGKQPPAT